MNKRIEDKLDELSLKVAKMRPVPRQHLDPSARVLDALDRGEELVCVKHFQGAGSVYQPGDRIIISDWSAARLAQMGTHGFIVPAGEYTKSLEYAAAADLLNNKLMPLRQTLDQARRAAQNAAIQVAVKTAELRQAEQEARTAADQVGWWESQLEEAMKGEDVLAVIG